jgi:hypothetical protein
MSGRRWITTWAAAGVLWLGGGCASTSTLQNSGRIPAAQAEVKVKGEDNGNSRVRLQVKHLAPPSAVRPDAQSYVVWIEPAGTSRPQNLGALQVDDDREAKLDATTPYHEFNLFVTAEPSPQAQVPTGEHLLRGRVD